MVHWGTVIAGAVGAIGGVGATLAGAWMNGRSQMAGLRLGIAADNDRAKVAEKRRIYAACLTALSDDLSAAIRRETFANTEETGKYGAALLTALNAVSELQLVAPSEVGRCGGTALVRLNHLKHFTDEARQAFVRALVELTKAMRADLGESPLTSDVAPVSSNSDVGESG
jgi:hypothetical protein